MIWQQGIELGIKGPGFGSSRQKSYISPLGFCCFVGIKKGLNGRALKSLLDLTSHIAGSTILSTPLPREKNAAFPLPDLGFLFTLKKIYT